MGRWVGWVDSRWAHPGRGLKQLERMGWEVAPACVIRPAVAPGAPESAGGVQSPDMHVYFLGSYSDDSTGPNPPGAEYLL